MFAIVRYLGIVGLLVVIAGAVLVGFYFKSIAETDILLPSLERQAESLTRSYNKYIWPKHRESILSELSQNKIRISTSKRFFYDNVMLFTGNSYIRINVFSPENVAIFSYPKQAVTLPDLTGYSGDYRQAIAGKKVSRIIKDAKYFDANSKASKQGTLARFVMPITHPENKNKTEALIEIYYELDYAEAYLKDFQFYTSASAVGIALALFLVIFIIYYRAEITIGKQHEANLELAEAKSRAESESREKSKFLANVSHELRTPLNAIIGFSDIIKDEVMGPVGNEQYREYIKDINNSGVHLLSLINDILDYSKAEAGKLVIDCVSVDLTKIIKSSIRLVLPRAESADVKLEEDIPKKHIVMNGDPKRIKQILLNLLSNSVKFTPEGGTVRLLASVEDQDETVTIIVQDTGIGIAAKDIAKAMSTFGQVDNSLSRRYEGTGLGLPFSKKLVEMMEGEFRLQSEVGIGTMVTLKFPLNWQPKEGLIKKIAGDGDSEAVEVIARTHNADQESNTDSDENPSADSQAANASSDTHDNYQKLHSATAGSAEPAEPAASTESDGFSSTTTAQTESSPAAVASPESGFMQMSYEEVEEEEKNAAPEQKPKNA